MATYDATSFQAQLTAISNALEATYYDRRVVEIIVLSGVELVTVADGKGDFTFTIPPELNGYNLIDADATVFTYSSSGTPTFQIRNVTDAVDMLSTKITIDINEYTSYTTATPPVIDTSKDDVATGDRLAFDCDVSGTGTKGLAIIMIFEKV